MKIVYMVETDEAVFLREGILPFFPVAGMLISLEGDDARTIESVWWNQSKPEELLVWFDDCDYMSTETMLSCGWQVDHPPVEQIHDPS